MTGNIRVAALAAAIAVLGCKGAQTTSASAPSNGAGATNTTATGSTSTVSASSSGTKLEYITDPTLNNMNVMPIQIPANWTFQGVLVPQGACTMDLSEVFRATSPDGHSFVEAMPRVGWKWGKLPGDTPAMDAACLPINAPMSAADFLKYFSTTMQVAYVGAETVPGAKGPQQTPAGVFTSAMADVQYKNGALNMKGVMSVGLYCKQPAPSAGRCDAIVSYMTAPDTDFASVRQIWSAPGMGKQPELAPWVAAYSQRYANQLQAQTTQFLNESNSAFAARQQSYKDAAAVQQQEHNQFLQTMQAGTDQSMANAAQVANSNHTMAADMVDYSLDRQTVMNVNTGQTGKISNQVTPSGALQKVHGDGTP